MVFHDILDGCVFVRISHSSRSNIRYLILVVNSSGVSKVVSVLSIQVYKTKYMDSNMDSTHSFYHRVT